VRVLTWEGELAAPPAALTTEADAAIYSFEAATGTWRYYLPGLPAQLNTLAQLEPGGDYYVVAE
jgi:hypothetical protein